MTKAVDLKLDYKPHEYQYQFHESDARFRCLFAGRRGGKTTAGAMEVIRQGLKHQGGAILVVAPSYGKLRDVCVPEVQRWLKSLGLDDKYQEVLHTIDSGYFKVKFRSADGEDITRGLGSDIYGVWLDEARDIELDTYRAIYPITADHAAPIWVTTTPNGYDWVFEQFWKKAEDGDPRYRCWRFHSSDNPYIDAAEIAQAQKDLPPDWFRQEYLAEFTENVGLVYKEFNESCVVQAHPIPSWWVCVEGIDFGTKNPTAVLWIVTDGHRFEVVQEYYRSNALLMEHAKYILEVRKGLRWPLVGTYLDPSAKQVAYEFAEHGIYCSPPFQDAQDKRILEGIATIGGLLASGRLKVWDQCVHLIEEFKRYRWPSSTRTADGSLRRERPKKEYDHALDALHYSVMGAKNADVRKPDLPMIPFERDPREKEVDGIPLDRLVEESFDGYNDPDDKSGMMKEAIDQYEERFS